MAHPRVVGLAMAGHSADDFGEIVALSSGTTNTINSVSYLGSSVLLLGDGGFVKTWNGTSIADFSMGGVSVPGGVNCYGYLGSYGLYITGSNGFLAAAPNGSTWAVATTGTANPIYAVATKGGASYVAVTRSGPALRSQDGLSWVSTSGGYGRDVACNGVIYVVVGSDGHISTSPDGLTWTDRYQPGGDSLFCVLWTGDKFVVGGAGGSGGVVFTSPDGITWTRRSPGVADWILDITASSASTLVAVGTNGLVLLSVDGGVTWARRYGPSSVTLNGVGLFWTGATWAYVMAGSNGALWKFG